MTIEQLKAQAYDLLVQIQRYQDMLQKVNQEIGKEQNKLRTANAEKKPVNSTDDGDK